jgi:hypothetical protein
MTSGCCDSLKENDMKSPSTRCLAGVAVLAGLAAYTAAAWAGDAADCLYLPPCWADRVVFYHTFDGRFDRPEINRIGAKALQTSGELASGFTGKGCRLPLGTAKNAAFEVSSPAISAHRPITLMCWFRLDRRMAETTWIGLLMLRGAGPYITHFVAGRGVWCGLREPTFISQIVAFPGISQFHNQWGGRAWFDEGVWHHVAMTVASASEVLVYRDGTLRDTIVVKGRTFKDHEVNTAAFGSQGHPMTIDECLVIDRALTADEIAQYVTSSRALREQNVPAVAR